MHLRKATMGEGKERALSFLETTNVNNQSLAVFFVCLLFKYMVNGHLSKGVAQQS